MEAAAQQLRAAVEKMTVPKAVLSLGKAVGNSFFGQEVGNLRKT